MASPAQITANQSNALHSTGPRTSEGKTPRRPKTPSVTDSPRSHPVVRDRRAQKSSPHSATRSPPSLTRTGCRRRPSRFQEILLAAWPLQRFSRIEAEVSTGTLEDFTNPATVAVLDRLSRYQARAQRVWSKGIAELRTLQTNRALRTRKLEPEQAAEVPAIASINDLTKQTHSEVTAEALKLAWQMIDVQAGMFVQRRRDRLAG